MYVSKIITLLGGCTAGRFVETVDLSVAEETLNLRDKNDNVDV